MTSGKSPGRALAAPFLRLNISGNADQVFSTESMVSGSFIATEA